MDSGHSGPYPVQDPYLGGPAHYPNMTPKWGLLEVPKEAKMGHFRGSFGTPLGHTQYGALRDRRRFTPFARN